MGDPVTTSLILSAGSSIAGGMSGAASASAAKQDAQVNSYIGRTRAIQTDAAARSGIESELASMRAVLAANGQRPNAGTMELFNEVRRALGRERDVEVGNRMQESRDYSRQARNAGTKSKFAMLGGLAGAAPSLFDLYDYKRK